VKSEEEEEEDTSISWKHEGFVPPNLMHINMK
jgi:hypothetical protein